MINFLLISACVFNSFLQSDRHRRDSIFLIAAMLFTLAADFNMLIVENYSMGITFFCMVQIIYFYRYSENCSLTLLISFFAASFFMLNLFIVSIVAIAICYFICFFLSLTSAIKAFVQKKYPYPNSYLILWGMALFCCCDINVALSYLNANQLSAHLIWVFYLPSQILLSFSAKTFKVRTFTE